MNMNSERYKSKFNNNSCSRYCRSSNLVKPTRTCNHVPTIQCHEEVMSKLSTCTNDGCIGEPDSNNKHPHHKKLKNNERKKRDGTGRSVCLQSKNVFESASVPVTTEEKDILPKNRKSKSIPLVHKPNLEDSVDFIPVKLSSDNDYKQRLSRTSKQRHNTLKAASTERASTRFTWDQILRGETNKICENSIPKERISKSLGNCENPKNKDTLPTTPKKKVSISDSNKICQKDNEEINSENNSVSSRIINPSIFNPFNSCDPVKTLDFLIKQLREKLLKQPENDNLQKIILDMENALLKISVENQVGLNIKHFLEKQSEDVESSSNIAPKSVFSNASDEKFQSRNGQLDVAQLQKRLEESCLFLQSLCNKQKERFNDHIQEKEQLTLQLAESRRLLAIAKSREKDYEVTIGELRLKLQEANTRTDQQSQSIQELTGTVTRLKSENEALQSFKEALKRLNSRLKETAREKEILQSKLCIKDLEIEKLKVLLEAKESQSSILNHKDKRFDDDELNIIISNEDKDNSLLSLSSVSSWSQDKQGIMCSSQASSSPRHSPSPYNSWQHISAIYQQPSAILDINKGINDIFQNLKKKSASNEPLKLNLEVSSSSTNSVLSNKEEINSKMIFSDGESGTLSS